MFLRTSPIYRISSDKVFWKSYQLFKDMFFWFIYYTQKGPRFSDTLMISNAVLLIFFGFLIYDSILLKKWFLK